MRKQYSYTVPIPQTGLGKNVHEQITNPKWYSHLVGGIRARLFGLITLALLPILLLQGWIYYERYEAHRTQALNTEVEVARGIATAFTTYVEGVHQQNDIIGQAILSSMLEDPEKITRLLTQTADQSPAVRNLSWVGPDGIVLVSSLPELVGKDLSVRRYFQEVKGGSHWAVGDMTSSGIVTEGPTFAIATGIQDGQNVLRGLVVSGLEPDRLDEVTLIQQRLAGGTFAIFDRQGVIVYTNTPDQPDWEGRVRWKENDPVLQRVLQTGQEQSGMINPGNGDGEWITARVPIAGVGYIAGARKTEELALMPIRRSLLQSALGAVLVWLVAILFALRVAQTISNPLHRLEQDARLMGTGKIEPYQDPSAPREVQQLRATVEAMAAALIQRAEALHESEARFRVLFHNRHTPMLVIDPFSRQIVDANPAASEYYGWTQDELRAMKITDINQLAPAQTQQEMGYALESKTSKQFHFRHRLASGEIRDVEVSSGPIQIQERAYLFSIVQDVTERKRAEEELRQATALLQALSESTPNPMFAKDREGRVLWTNPASLEVLGKTLEQVLGHTESDWIEDPQQAETIATNDRRVMESGQSEVLEETIRTPQGTRIFLMTKSPLRGSDGEVIGLAGLGQDVTERLQAEQELRERSEGLALLSEAAHELLSGSDPVDMLGRIYPRLASLLGLDAYIHYRTAREDTHLVLAGFAGVPESFPNRYSRIDFGQSVCGQAAQNRAPAIIADVQHSTDPDTRLIRSLGFTAYACHPLIVQDQLVGTLSFGSRRRTDFDPQAINLMNTTAALLAAAINRRQAESTLQVYAGRLEESNHNLQEFAFIASHDLQEPLRKVESFGSLILRDSENLEEHQRDYLERMRQAASRMRQMVLDLLELSRVNTQTRAFKRVDLAKTAQEVLSDLEFQMHQTQGNVVVETLPEIYADPLQMHQLLQNLIGNALKYHRPEVAPVVSVRSKNVSANRVEIRIEDNGIGFDPAQTERIFQPFQRLVGKSEYEGTGIGLAICRKIIERHNGTITAESVPGQGSVFTIHLPIHQANGTQEA